MSRRLWCCQATEVLVFPGSWSSLQGFPPAGRVACQQCEENAEQATPPVKESDPLTTGMVNFVKVCSGVILATCRPVLHASLALASTCLMEGKHTCQAPGPSPVLRARMHLICLLSPSVIVSPQGYKQLVSPLLPPACRFFPTCSEYAIQAIQE
jgi:hypothetical protein